jgi:hypothetical protein
MDAFFGSSMGLIEVCLIEAFLPEFLSTISGLGAFSVFFSGSYFFIFTSSFGKSEFCCTGLIGSALLGDLLTGFAGATV